MHYINNISQILCHPANYSSNAREYTAIKYIVMHYTGNIGDTAKNNAEYFHSNPVQSSAHFFVSEDSVYMSVPPTYAAWAVGLGSRKEPYIKWPSLWKKANNKNSISIEMCGGPKSREATQKTKETACKLAADLMHDLDLTPSCLCRHYDITGKKCPAWAVDEPLKWLELKTMTCNYFYGKEEGDEMLNTDENYKVFREFMKRYEMELSETPAADWEKEPMQFCKDKGLMNGQSPKSKVTRGELAVVLKRMNAGT